jgi:hypothetical protein
MSWPNANVASARYRPVSRMTGSATSAPTAVVTATANSSAQSEPPERATISAPSPANVSCARET